MSQIIDTLFIKRFCLPSNMSLSNTHLSSCLCGNFNHASCIFEGKGR